MRNDIAVNYINYPLIGTPGVLNSIKTQDPEIYDPVSPAQRQMPETEVKKSKPEILFITSYPPRECGIATYSQDLIKVLTDKFSNSFKITVCPLESENEKYTYESGIKHTLNIDLPNSFFRLAKSINANPEISAVMIQHEFGLFEKKENEFKKFLGALIKPSILVYHTVLPQPDASFKLRVQEISGLSESIVVLTNSSAQILKQDYGVPEDKITVIAHGTHLVPNSDKEFLKRKYKLEGKRILSTFGLLSSGKSIETTLEALPLIVKKNPNILFLIIGKTHPSVVKREGERYRRMLEEKIAELKMEPYVQFVNYFLPLNDLLEYLQLTDVYLFTSKDPNQAVSGTFSYAISCGCAVISTPIPHAREVLQNDMGIIIDFDSPQQLNEAVTDLLNNEERRNNISSNGLHRMASTCWENAAIGHAKLFEKIGSQRTMLRYNMPEIKLDHVKKLTTDFGMIQFSRISRPDIDSGYTLDDNARALIAMCQHFELTGDETDLQYIGIYFNFIKYCLQPQGHFLNYVDQYQEFTEQNDATNLADANGRAIWALGYLISVSHLFPEKFRSIAANAEIIFKKVLPHLKNIHSTRAMAFTIKGLYYHNLKCRSGEDVSLTIQLTNRLVQMYRHESGKGWQWFESYLTYANSTMPEAMLCAWLTTGEEIYLEIAKTSFDFLLSKIFYKNQIKVISNNGWMHKKDVIGKAAGYALSENVEPNAIGGEQPIDVAYTILALSKFYDAFKNEEYRSKIITSFNWFLGNNQLNQIIYNPCTGGCYDGLEKHGVNLNQGAESTVGYLIARLTLENFMSNHQNKTRYPTTHGEKQLSEYIGKPQKNYKLQV